MLQPALLLLMSVSMEVTFTSQSEPKMSQVSVLEGSKVILHCSTSDRIETKCWSKQNFPQASGQSEIVGCLNENICKSTAGALNCLSKAIRSDDKKYSIMTLGNNASRLIIDNIQQKDGGTYCCCVDKRNEPWIYDLTVIKGCKRDLMNQTDFTGNDILTYYKSNTSACREHCTQSERCQFFTFQTSGNCYLKRFPIDSKSIDVTFAEDKISGYSLRNCSGKEENPMNDGSGSPSTNCAIGPPTSSSSPTPPGYLHYYNSSRSWIDALVFCEAKNRSLVHITNSTVQEHVAQLLDKVKLPQGVWIGLERAVFLVNSSWVWTSGPVVQNYTQWHKYFPLNPFQFHCGKMIRDSNCTLTWLDACCHVKLPFICQDLNH